MQNYKLDIRVVKDDQYEIEFHSSDVTKYTFKCDQAYLSSQNIGSVEDLTISMIRKIIKYNHIHIVKEVKFDSSVISFKNKLKNIQFQIEDGLVLMRKLKGDQEEFFFPLNNKSIDQLKSYTLTNFNSLKKKKKKIVPLTTRIETLETNFGF